MSFVLAALFGVSGALMPMMVHAESADVVAKIKSVDTKKLLITLDDGKTYQAPEEFNFEGLVAGVKVVIFFTDENGKRVINDLQVVK